MFSRRALRSSPAFLVGLCLCLVSFSVAFFGPPRVAAQEVIDVLEGFQVRRTQNFPSNVVGLGGLDFTSDGDLVVYDGGELLLIDETGTATLLASFGTETFGSFVVLAPSGDAVIVAESTNQGIYEVPLAGGAPEQIDTLSYAFDLIFDSEGRGFVSAPATDSVGNEIFLLDHDPSVETPNRPLVVDIPGFSGPVAFDDKGRLYYGTVDFDALSQKIVRFSTGQIDTALSGTPASFNDAEVVLSEIDSVFDMVFAHNSLLYSDLGFSANEGRIWRLDGDDNFRESLLVSLSADETLPSPSYLAYHSGSVEFHRGVGVGGGTLAVAYSNFSTLNRVTFVVPQRFFVRGEVNGDGSVDFSDAVWILFYLFFGGAEPDPLEAADIDGSGEVDSNDAILLLQHLFLGGPAPAAPYPEPGAV